VKREKKGRKYSEKEEDELMAFLSVWGGALCSTVAGEIKERILGKDRILKGKKTSVAGGTTWSAPWRGRGSRIERGNQRGPQKEKKKMQRCTAFLRGSLGKERRTVGDGLKGAGKHWDPGVPEID